MPYTPPPSPTSSRDAARHHERSQRIICSPENHRIPTGPLIPSTSTHSLRVQPTNLSTQLSSIPSYHHQNGPHTSTSAPPLAPAPIITSMAPPPLPSHRQTLTSAQLTAAYAALPPLNPPQSRSRPISRRGPSTRPSSIPPQDHQNTHPPFAQLLAAYTTLPSLNPQPRSRPQAVSVYNMFFIMPFN
jgi:hypothetical protein